MIQPNGKYPRGAGGHNTDTSNHPPSFDDRLDQIQSHLTRAIGISVVALFAGMVLPVVGFIILGEAIRQGYLFQRAFRQHLRLLQDNQ